MNKSDAQLLDVVMEKYNLKNDAELAALLNVTRTSIHVIRHKNGRLGIKGRLKLIDKIGYRNASNWVERLTPSYLSEKIKALNAKRAQKIIDNNKESPNREQSEFIDLMKLLFDCHTDIELSQKLNLRPNTISMYRTGKTTIGEKPLLQVLSELEGINIEEFYELLDDSDALSKAIEKSKK